MILQGYSPQKLIARSVSPLSPSRSSSARPYKIFTRVENFDFQTEDLEESLKNHIKSHALYRGDISDPFLKSTIFKELIYKYHSHIDLILRDQKKLKSILNEISLERRQFKNKYEEIVQDKSSLSLQIKSLKEKLACEENERKYTQDHFDKILKIRSKLESDMKNYEEKMYFDHFEKLKSEVVNLQKEKEEFLEIMKKKKDFIFEGKISDINENNYSIDLYSIFDEEIKIFEKLKKTIKENLKEKKEMISNLNEKISINKFNSLYKSKEKFLVDEKISKEEELKIIDKFLNNLINEKNNSKGKNKNEEIVSLKKLIKYLEKIFLKKNDIYNNFINLKNNELNYLHKEIDELIKSNNKDEFNFEEEIHKLQRNKDEILKEIDIKEIVLIEFKEKRDLENRFEFAKDYFSKKLKLLLEEIKLKKQEENLISSQIDTLIYEKTNKKKEIEENKKSFNKRESIIDLMNLKEKYENKRKSILMEEIKLKNEEINQLKDILLSKKIGKKHSEGKIKQKEEEKEVIIEKNAILSEEIIKLENFKEELKKDLKLKEGILEELNQQLKEEEKNGPAVVEIIKKYIMKRQNLLAEEINLKNEQLNLCELQIKKLGIIENNSEKKECCSKIFNEFNNLKENYGLKEIKNLNEEIKLKEKENQQLKKQIENEFADKKNKRKP